MTTAIHKFAANLGIAIGLANATARRSAPVGFCFSVDSRRVLVPLGV